MSRNEEMFLQFRNDTDGQSGLIEIQSDRRLLCFATDCDATVTFYRDVLEIPLLYDKRSEGQSPRALFNAGPSGLIQVLPLPLWRKNSIRFSGWLRHGVDDVDVWYRRLSQLGIPVIKQTSYTSGAVRSFAVSDPNGYEITFVRKRQTRP